VLVLQVLTFLNAFQLLNDGNQVAVYGMHSLSAYVSWLLLASPTGSPHITGPWIPQSASSDPVQDVCSACKMHRKAVTSIPNTEMLTMHSCELPGRAGGCDRCAPSRAL
jgi:hypothetical protein